MKRSKAFVLVAAAALAALGVLAVGQAAGSSSVWLHNGEPLNEPIEISLKGGDLIEIGSSAFLCNATAMLTTEGGSTAQITAYNVETSRCAGLAGKFEGCKVTTATARNLPWRISVNSVDLTAHEVGVAYSFDEACPIQEVETSFPGLTLTPEEPSAIRLFHFGEKGTGEVDGEEATLTDGGTLQMPEADFGTYGIG